jgi:hypothetical protein
LTGLLLHLAQGPRSAQELASAGGEPGQKDVTAELDRLTMHGIITAETVHGSTRWRLRIDHPMFDQLRASLTSAHVSADNAMLVHLSTVLSPYVPQDLQLCCNGMSGGSGPVETVGPSVAEAGMWARRLTALTDSDVFTRIISAKRSACGTTQWTIRCCAHETIQRSARSARRPFCGSLPCVLPARIVTTPLSSASAVPSGRRRPSLSKRRPVLPRMLRRGCSPEPRVWRMPTLGLVSVSSPRCTPNSARSPRPARRRWKLTPVSLPGERLLRLTMTLSA